MAIFELSTRLLKACVLKHGQYFYRIFYLFLFLLKELYAAQPALITINQMPFEFSKKLDHYLHHSLYLPLLYI